MTDFQKKVLRYVPKWPGKRSVRNIVTKVYDDGWQGWRKARGRTIAVIRALNKLQDYKLVTWNSHPLSKNWQAVYWYKT